MLLIAKIRAYIRLVRENKTIKKIRCRQWNSFSCFGVSIGRSQFRSLRAGRGRLWGRWLSAWVWSRGRVGHSVAAPLCFLLGKVLV